jgi:ABC-type transport system involved in multi-copper enzyme maturation permease subunit
MTASIINDAGAASVSTPFGPFAGFRALLRKDATEWVRARRGWVILIVTGLFMAFAGANAWIATRLIAVLPAEAVDEVSHLSLVPIDNLMRAVSSQIFIVAAIFAAGGLIGRERESGTLAWVASKPVTRSSIWLAKWTSATVMLSVYAGLIPLAVTSSLVVLLYGPLPIGLVVGLAIGMVAIIAFFVAVGLVAGTFLPGQPAAIAVGVAVLALLPIVASLVPFPIEPYLPTAMLAWPAAVLSGQATSWATPIAWLAITGGLAVLGIRRIGRLEL